METEPDLGTTRVSDPSKPQLARGTESNNLLKTVGFVEL
jgi:hypothetical protein